ncbi:hypothetical protein PZN02_001804 [Sinorhizobium garamanticum]|uniref:DUF1127 domain-containing protein n=1 Tax=Sinorhizobium garamanticum TaxID=680247 RepID=A0ABY8DEC6_9HYPH|nr:hypothetical protein [Sinorhizobium garamanticum]WEX89244.1 hypothetical protein PZN02_001804 [Sinorhizobium garamanticum]
MSVPFLAGSAGLSFATQLRGLFARWRAWQTSYAAPCCEAPWHNPRLLSDAGLSDEPGRLPDLDATRLESVYRSHWML